MLEKKDLLREKEGLFLAKYYSVSIWIKTTSFSSFCKLKVIL